jgi:hypothetical protein
MSIGRHDKHYLRHNPKVSAGSPFEVAEAVTLMFKEIGINREALRS